MTAANSSTGIAAAAAAHTHGSKASNNKKKTLSLHQRLRGDAASGHRVVVRLLVGLDGLGLLVVVVALLHLLGHARSRAVVHDKLAVLAVLLVVVVLLLVAALALRLQVDDFGAHGLARRPALPPTASRRRHRGPPPP